jgi:hypothetical protein
MNSLKAMQGSKYKCVDAHLHVNDFIQETEGLVKCLHYMKKANITQAVIFGIPVSKLWASWEKYPPGYYLGDNSRCYYYSGCDFIMAGEYRALQEQDRKLLLPLIGGFNPCDKFAYRHIHRMIKYFPEMWHGIGEILFRHDDLTNLIYGDPPRCNHNAMDRVYELCVEYEMPICIHQNITSVGTSDYPQWLHELEETLQNFPRATIVWAHCGVSRRVYSPIYYQIVERLLAKYENLYVDFSWVVYDDFICPKGIPDEQWVHLAEDYSTKICIGTDVVNRFEQLPATIQKYDVFLAKLSNKARRNLASDTALKLYGTIKA